MEQLVLHWNGCWEETGLFHQEYTAISKSTPVFLLINQKCPLHHFQFCMDTGDERIL